jgi:hypothetical protein
MTSPALTCPEPGLWRAWLDEEIADQAPALADHLAACSACRDAVGEQRGNADLAARAVDRLLPGMLPTPAAVAVALDRLHGRVEGIDPREGAGRAAGAHRAPLASPASAGAHVERPRPGRPVLGSIGRRWRIAAGGIAAALALAILVATPEGQAAAAAVLSQFRSQRLAVVTFDSSTRRSSLAELERLGTVAGDRRGREPVVLQTIGEASQRAGFSVRLPDPATIPAGLDKSPRIKFTPASEFRFTFDRDKARAYLQANGRPDVANADKFHGATLVVNTPPVVLLQYAKSAQDLGLSIAQTGQVTARAEGRVSLDELRAFLLTLPNVPPDLARQLNQFRPWEDTLPVPVPVDKVKWQATTITNREGVKREGLLLADNSGLGSAVLWPDGNQTYGVVGPGKADEILRVANSVASGGK